MTELIKPLADLLQPFPVALSLLALGCVLLWARQPRGGRALVSLSLLLLVASSIDPTVTSLLQPLEGQYAALPTLATAPVRYVVLMGAAYDEQGYMPLSNRPNVAAMRRLLEGLEQYHAHPGSRLIVSGKGTYEGLSYADKMAALVQRLGVPAGDILIQNQSNNTEQEVALLAPMVGSAPFIVVTSAAHMPRTLYWFNRAGLHPLPAPTHYLGQLSGGWAQFPHLDNIERTGFALHEYAGLAWQWLREKFQK